MPGALVHVANVLYLFSYLARDILWLRILTVVAASCLIPYFWLRPEPLVAPIAWNVIFTAINLVQIVRLLLERRPVVFTPAEQRLHQLVFRRLTPQEAKRLLAFARWADAAVGERVVAHDVWLDRLLLIDRGRLGVEIDGQRVAELHDGQFVGEMGFVSDSVTCADVVALAPTRFVWWPRTELQTFLDRDAGLRAAIELILGVDLASKLRPAHASSAETRVESG